MKYSGYFVCFLSVILVILDLCTGDGLNLGWVTAAIWSYLAASNSKE